jgi:hypothetical protein
MHSTLYLLASTGGETVGFLFQRHHSCVYTKQQEPLMQYLHFTDYKPFSSLVQTKHTGNVAES